MNEGMAGRTGTRFRKAMLDVSLMVFGTRPKDWFRTAFATITLEMHGNLRYGIVRFLCYGAWRG